MVAKAIAEHRQIDPVVRRKRHRRCFESICTLVVVLWSSSCHQPKDEALSVEQCGSPQSHRAIDAFVTLANRDKSEDDPIFALSVFEDGCFQLVGDPRIVARSGELKAEVIEELNRRVEATNWRDAPNEILIDAAPGPDYELTIRVGTTTKTVKYSEVFGEYWRGVAQQRGSVIGARLINLTELGDSLLHAIGMR